MGTITYTLSIPTDNGFIGRECNSCNKYFKIYLDDKKDNLYCPYCGTLQPDDETWTKDQRQVIDKVAEDFITKFVEDQLDKVFGDLANGNEFVSSPENRTV